MTVHVSWNRSINNTEKKNNLYFIINCINIKYNGKQLNMKGNYVKTSFDHIVLRAWNHFNLYLFWTAVLAFPKCMILSSSSTSQVSSACLSGYILLCICNIVTWISCFVILFKYKQNIIIVCSLTGIYCSSCLRAGRSHDLQQITSNGNNTNLSDCTIIYLLKCKIDFVHKSKWKWRHVCNLEITLRCLDTIFHLTPVVLETW